MATWGEIKNVKKRSRNTDSMAQKNDPGDKKNSDAVLGSGGQNTLSRKVLQFLFQCLIYCCWESGGLSPVPGTSSHLGCHIRSWQGCCTSHVNSWNKS